MDTETQNGKAVLLTVAGPEDAVDYLEFPKTFLEIFEWLASIASKYTCFNMDYDARAWFKFLPRSAWMNLYRYKGILWHGLKISYLDGKYFSVRRGNLSVVLFDCCQHYQSSLRVAMRFTLGREKHEIPQSWYRDIEGALQDPSRRPKVIAYALEDARGCRDLWAKLDAQYRKLGVDPRALARPLSPGQIAAGFFGDKIRFRLDRKHNAIAQRGYRGGRIEVYKRGYLPKVYAYDLKSAYPWALSKLPDPRGLKVMETGKGEENGQALYSIYCVRVRIGEDVGIPPVARFGGGDSDDVRLIYPTGAFKCWLTGPEVDLLKRNGWLQEIMYGIHLVGERRPWLVEIPRLFRLRKTNPAISTAIKLVLNSIYGKFAQQRPVTGGAHTVDTGTRRFNGEWISSIKVPGKTTNFFVASYITAMVRVRLWETMNAVGFEHCCLAATDGLVTVRPLPKHLIGNGKLGDWIPSFDGAGKALIVGTGVYSLFYNGKWHDKVRGFRPTSPMRRMLTSKRTRIKVKNRVAYTLGDFALHGSELNDMVEINRTLDVNFDRKRAWPRYWAGARQLLRTSQSSLPLILLQR
jgi:hypothetical protein